ncbi:hypothetical protein LPB87_06490 [Flavobacterium sp. EDS]|uniref:hypothetical protein n=1 Tax=Flavobacterium sp. EDS TaxID=2897328 RepID=UPI001E3C5222|nr:hypothetical protein [Flavobacterium sp. EDS]MCD0474040.1 hypothetical protein [Flavobacterium sp. EDS]
MQNINLNYSTNNLEKLFIEKSIESLYQNSIDSYRLRLHNPKTLIEELITVTQSSINGILTNNDYVNYTSKELKKILSENNDELKFVKINKKHYTGILEKADRKNYKLIIQSSKLILRDNQEYCSNIFNKIKSITESYSSFFDEENNFIESKKKVFDDLKKDLIVLGDYLYIELLSKGFTKQYLYKTFQSIFIYNSNTPTFSDKIAVFKSIIDKADENFTVIFLINDNSFQFSELKKIDNSYNLIDKKYRRINKTKISDEVYNFLEKNKEKILISLDFKSKDYFKAIQLGINKLSKDLDIYHLGYNNKHFKIDAQCATIGEKEPLKASISPSNFQIDGYFKSDSDVFADLLQKITTIKTKSIDPESFDKILSAIRYYRTGSESPELETKLLNYWIGLEFIFTSFNSDEKTIDRIRNYFPKCHSLIYVKRNLYDFHRSLRRLGLKSNIINYNDDLKYFIDHNSYNTINNNTNSELLKFRTVFFKKWHEEPNKIEDVLKKHQDNLTWNITRLYRIRNEIVHNAAIKNGIHTHIAHLKYYLSFTLNSILNFMSDVTVDVNNDGKVSIEDYFITQEIILGALKGEKLEKFLEIDNPNEIFQ